jgi:hypothetical protein
MIIEQPHGYLLDADGRVVLRFAGWSTGDHDVPEAVTSVEYVSDPGAHDREVHTEYKTQP